MWLDNLKLFAANHLHNGFYYESVKTGQSIEDCLAKIPFNDCYMLPCDEEPEDCPYVYQNASIFLKGSCNLFAKALHEIYKYDIYEIVGKNNKDNHWYTTSDINGRTLYIDVRGATTSFEELLSAFNGNIEYYCIPTKKEIEQLDFPDEVWIDTGLMFAFSVINENPDYYGEIIS